ncbi:MAG: hypothetical protein PF637_12275 [Spirochaetes bacterium]|jgi:hypothetical protein|nr:hypothetical protein [Spirochaetota bacterium]
MSKRKKILIDKKFQLRTVFALLGIKIIIVSILVCIVGIYALKQNKKISNIIEIEDNIVQVLSLPVAISENFEESEDSDGVSETTESNLTAIENAQKISLKLAQDHDQNMKELRRMIKINQGLIWVIVAIIFIQGVILFFILLRQTHRIAGPVYVMTMYMKSIINGKFPDHLRPLRDKDFLKDFYKVFSEMVETLKQREGK